jgi:hypothetical protein
VFSDCRDCLIILVLFGTATQMDPENTNNKARHYAIMQIVKLQKVYGCEPALLSYKEKILF